MLKLDANDSNERRIQKINSNMESLEDIHICTGFIAPNNNQGIGVAYNATTRKITLTGSFVAFMDGKVVPQLTNGWVSPAHANVTGVTYYLRYDGTQFLFDTTPWSYGDINIASVQFGATNKIALREVHGAGMLPSTHRNLHLNVGTTRTSTTVIFTGFALNSTTLSDRKPLINAVTLLDEDFETVVSALSDETHYCWRYLTGSAVRTIETAKSEMLNVTGNVPNYNQNVGGTWQQTPFPVNAYGAIFIVAIPVTSEAGSQAFRYMFCQPQTVSTDLGTIQKLAPSDYVRGTESSLVDEYNFIGKIIIQYKSANWTLISVEELRGSKFQQTSGSIGYGLATQVSDGLMSSVDKLKLDTSVITVDSEVPTGYETSVATATVAKGTFSGNVLLGQIIELALNNGNTAVSPTITIGGVTYSIVGMPTIAPIWRQTYRLKKTGATTLTFSSYPDYIFETYHVTVGDCVWEYERWASGRARCWTRHNVGSVVVGTLITSTPFAAGYAMYEGVVTLGHNFPFTFNVLTYCNTTHESNGTGYGLALNQAQPATTLAPSGLGIVRIQSASNTLANVILCVMAEGMW